MPEEPLKIDPVPSGLTTPVQVRKLSPDLVIEEMRVSLGDFWSWAYSNLLTNIIRGAFAEYVVAQTLGIADRARIDWNAFDLSYRGKRIEVKSSAYLQSWPQRKMSQVSFDVAAKMPWDAETGKSLNSPQRSADCYVFCLYKETDLSGRTPTAVLDLNRWCFYTATLAELEEKFGVRRRASLKALSEFGPFSHAELKSKIEEKLGLV
jgi:hypothetical protein